MARITQISKTKTIDVRCPNPGPNGPAAPLYCSIIAHIACDALETNAALDRPLLGDHVCEYDNLAPVDGLLTATDKNIVCRVYLCPAEQSLSGEVLVEGATMELPWWPKD